MATREENLKKINAELEQLSDEELEQVVGGACKLYCFFYMPLPDGQIMWLDKPITAGIATNPASVLADNIELLTGHNTNAKVTSKSEFRDYVKNFANKNASHWSSPKTWGNLVFSVGLDGKSERFEA